MTSWCAATTTVRAHDYKRWFSKSHTIKRKCYMVLRMSYPLCCCICFWYRVGLICCKLLQATHRNNSNLYNTKIGLVLCSSSLWGKKNLSGCLQMALAQNNPQPHPRRPQTYCFHTFSIPTEEPYWHASLKNLPRAWIYVSPIRAELPLKHQYRCWRCLIQKICQKPQVRWIGWLS